MYRLNLGCGGQIAEGWQNIERQFDPAAVAAADPDAAKLERDLRDGLPYEDGDVKYAVAHHALCMLAPPDVDALLVEVARVLPSGGVLRVSTVDFRFALRAWYERDEKWFRDLGVPVDALPPTAVDVLDWYVSWGGTRVCPFFSPAHLSEYLIRAGLWPTEVAYHETTYSEPAITELDARPGESFYMEGRKP